MTKERIRNRHMKSWKDAHSNEIYYQGQYDAEFGNVSLYKYQHSKHYRSGVKSVIGTEFEFRPDRVSHTYDI